MTTVSVNPTETSLPERKTDKVRRLVREGDFKAALRIAKGFTRGITYGQHDAMTIAYECMVNPRFYTQVGVDIEESIGKGVEVVKLLFP